MLWRRRKPGLFFWKLFLGNAALMTVLLGGAAWVISGAVEQFRFRETRAYLESHARILAVVLGEHFDPVHAQELGRHILEVNADQPHGIRITLIAGDGTVLADTQVRPLPAESYADRPEIKEALELGRGEVTRWSHALDKRMQYLAVRIGSKEAPRGVIRVALPVEAVGVIGGASHRLNWTILLVGLAAPVALALGLARLWSGRIARLTKAARSLSRGDLAGHIDVGGRDEIALLARSLNRMRDNLARQLETIDRHRREFESLLGQLHEGVVVAYPNGRIMLVNPEAARLLDLPKSIGPTGPGKNGPVIEECVSRFELQQMLRSSRTGPENEPPGTGEERHVPETPSSETLIHEARLELPGGQGTVFVLARAADIALPGVDESGRYPASGDQVITGRLLVLTDITEITRTIQIKTDFVANASHELRTPLSAIRAAVETVMNLNLAEEAESARRFLQVVERHSARLEALVEDLLALSRVESSAGRFEHTELNIKSICQQLQERWSKAAADGQVELTCEIESPAQRAVADGHLLQLILDNLVDNAIKFTAAGGHVKVRVRGESDQMALTVMDDGCGIAPEEHQRVFERFYQVERARTGTGSQGTLLRGTGLGLSIVRHAAAAMKGTVTLQSQPGLGTQVTLLFPQKPRNLPVGTG